MVGIDMASSDHNRRFDSASGFSLAIGLLSRLGKPQHDNQSPL